MNLNQSKSLRPWPLLSPKPGEIWAMGRSHQFPLAAKDSLGEAASDPFAKAQDACRYVMIVNKFPLFNRLDSAPECVSAMLLSDKTDYLSEVDILLPAKLSTLGQDLLCETWNIIPLMAYRLSHSVGRVSRQIYDALLTLGETHGASGQPLEPQSQDSPTLQSLGLQSGRAVATQPAVQEFHQEEQQWGAELGMTFAADAAEQKALQLAEVVLEEAILLEQDLLGCSMSSSVLESRALNSQILQKHPISLGQWLRHCIEPGWLQVKSLWDLQTLNVGMAFRSSDDRPEQALKADEIRSLIDRLALEQDESQRRSIIRRFADRGAGCTDVIEAIATLLKTTVDDETLWAAAECLSRLDPSHAASVSCVKTIDLGMQVANQSLQLVVSLLEKANQKVSIWLRVCPESPDGCLPTGLELVVLDDQGTPIRTLKSRPSDVLMQLKLNGDRGESFGVRLALNDASLTEHFII